MRVGCSSHLAFLLQWESTSHVAKLPRCHGNCCEVWRAGPVCDLYLQPQRRRDIVENLREGEHPEHQPDLMSRVFHLHLAELLLDIKAHHVLWVPVAHVYVIELQKRSMYHTATIY